MEKIYLLRENGTNGVHKAHALEDLIGLPVVNTPVGVKEPDHAITDQLISLKYAALVSAFTKAGVCAVADLVTTIGGTPSRKPPADLAPHELAPYIADQMKTEKRESISFIEESTIAFGTKPGGLNPLIGVSKLNMTLPTQLMKNRRFIEDMHGASGLGKKVAEIPGGIELGTTIALVRKNGQSPRITPPQNFHHFIEAHPRYIMQRMARYEELDRLNQVILKYLTPREIVILLDSALNASGHMVKPLWDKFSRQ